jgi:hypothetical protein
MENLYIFSKKHAFRQPPQFTTSAGTHSVFAFGGVKNKYATHLPLVIGAK